MAWQVRGNSNFTFINKVLLMCNLTHMLTCSLWLLSLVELSNCSRDPLACKAENICHLVLASPTSPGSGQLGPNSHLLYPQNHRIKTVASRGSRWTLEGTGSCGCPADLTVEQGGSQIPPACKILDKGAYSLSPEPLLRSSLAIHCRKLPRGSSLPTPRCSTNTEH